MSRVRRILTGTMANGLNLGYLTIVALATTPALVAAWGPTRYGVWLMLTAIPTYLALSDLGFATAARNTMAMTIARGERERSVQIFHSLIALHFLVFAIIVAITTTLLIILSYMNSLPLLHEYFLTAFILSLLSCLTMFARVILSALLAAGHYTRATMYYDVGQFIAGMAILPAALMGGGFVVCVAISMACWGVVVAALWRLLSLTVAWLPVGVAGSRIAVLRDLLRPALGSLAIPAALALNQQGVALIVGLALSPAATATLTAVRTATRLAVQGVSVVNRASVQELSVASAHENHVAVARILWINVLAAGAMLTPVALVFVFFGASLISLWTGGAIVPGQEFVLLMTLGMVLHTCWYFGTSLLMATNAHLSMVGVLVATSVVMIVLSWPAAHYFGLNGVALVATLLEAACVARFWFAGQAAGMALPTAVLMDMVRAKGPR